MAARWWRYSVTWMGAGENREDAMMRARALFDELPLMGLQINVHPMGDSEALRILDREQSKQQIEGDTDSGNQLLTSLDIPIVKDPGPASGLVGGIVPMPGPPPHPWDEGLWFFPEGHPLAAAERWAKEANDRGLVDRLKELEEGKDDPQV